MASDADAAAIAALTQKVVAAWAHQDADSFASVFVEDGTMILAGVYCEGRDAVREHMAKAFQGPYKDTQVTGTPTGMRFLGPDVAILLSEGGVLGAGETEVTDDSAIRASWLATRQDDGQWLLAAYQNTPRNDTSAGGSAARAA
jgi:uncharacterized protein (TIGR02246 family)